MAKILIVARHLHPTALDLAHSLQHNHEINVVTSRAEDFSGTYDFPILCFFQSWNFLEALRFLPVLIQTPPDIVHFLCENENLNIAEIFIAEWASRFHTSLLSTSLFRLHDRVGWGSPLRHLLESSHVVTCANVPMMSHLRGLNVKSRRQARGILPPLLKVASEVQNHAEGIEQPEPEWFERIQNRRLIVIPFGLKSLDFDDSTIEYAIKFPKEYFIVFIGSYSDWSLRDKKAFSHFLENSPLKGRWLLTGDMDESQILHLMTYAEALFVAQLELSALEINRWLLLGSSAPISIIMDTNQASIHSQIWRNRENCWILSMFEPRKDLFEILALPSLRLYSSSLQSLKNSLSHQLDSPVNELNRLYQRALNEKSLGQSR